LLIMHTRIPVDPTAKPPLTEAALCRWLGAAAPGDAVVYHRGALGRQLCPQLACLPAGERVALARVAKRARELAEAGLAHLVQRRLGSEDYEYILVARSRPLRIAPSVLPAILAEAA
jgi:hypothetical protein